MKVYAKVPDACGVYASVMFQNGVGETDDPHLLKWFKRHGFTLETEIIPQNDVVVETPVVETEPVDEEVMMGVDDDPDFEKMTSNEIRDWALEHGLGHLIKNTKNKQKLIEKLKA